MNAKKSIKKTAAKKAAAKPEKKPAENTTKTVVQLDWAFRRLCNQAACYYANGDREALKRHKAELLKCKKYADVVDYFAMKPSPKTDGWNGFMNTFFGHEINKTFHT